jgi:UDP-3-O-acyl-N-acetylglucosamine deacetylase
MPRSRDYHRGAWSTGADMKYLSYAYRFVSNFAFLALVYFSLNFIGEYQQRTVIAVLVLVYAAMRAISALRTFYFYKSIERLEFETRRLGGLSMEGPTAVTARKAIVQQVVDLRQAGEMKSYIDLLFLAIIVVLCLAKIVA